MESRFRLTHPELVRGRIAQLILGDAHTESTIGSVSLQPHQLSAVARLQSALDEFGGGLLCDEVGMGKTFVATCVARRYARPLVVAPAALAEMWKQSLALTETGADFVSFEKLSRSDSRIPRSKGSAAVSGLAPYDTHDLVVIDEAHHARNAQTRRYAQLRRLARNARVLLLTATPIHNRLRELSSLLSLFLGSRARNLTTSELARCIIRRGHGQLQTGALIPKILPLVTLPIGDCPEIVRHLLALPSPIPVRDGGLAAALIGRGLVHQWASSEATLQYAIVKRLAKSTALIASLEAGVYPNQRELESWTFADGAVQLGFAELLSPPIVDASTLLASVKQHADALRAFRSAHSGRSLLDDQRADALLQIRARHPTAKIVAFAQYAKTVAMLYRKLAGLGGVAMLTAQGAYVSGGKLSRQEALARFAPRAFRKIAPSTAERIDLLITTDLLSEGVNLQDAEVLVHLDLPWTSARMEQRLGRVARMGSAHSSIQPYLVRPPSSAVELLDSERLISRKWNLARRVLGSNTAAPVPDATGDVGEEDTESGSRMTEKLRSILTDWLRPEGASDETLTAAVASERSGFLAVINRGGRPELVVRLSGSVSTSFAPQIEACLLAEGVDADSTPEDYESAIGQLRLWLETESASTLAGVSDSSVVRRRRLLNRIDSAIATAPPHFRSTRLAAAAIARQLVSAPQSAAIEAELEALGRSQISDEAWLEALSHLDTRRPSFEEGIGSDRPLVQALLLLKAKAPTT